MYMWTCTLYIYRIVVQIYRSVVFSHIIVPLHHILIVAFYILGVFQTSETSTNVFAQCFVLNRIPIPPFDSIPWPPVDMIHSCGTHQNKPSVLQYWSVWASGPIKPLYCEALPTPLPSSPLAGCSWHPSSWLPCWPAMLPCWPPWQKATCFSASWSHQLSVTW